MTTGEPKRTLDRTGAILDSAPVVAANFMVAWVFGVAALKAGFPLWLPVAMCMFFTHGRPSFRRSRCSQRKPRHQPSC